MSSWAHHFYSVWSYTRALQVYFSMCLKIDRNVENSEQYLYTFTTSYFKYSYITEICLINLSQQIKAAVKIQSAFRGFTKRRDYKRQRAAAAILQQRFRALQFARAERENLRMRHDAAVRLQAACRGWLGRRQASRRLRIPIYVILEKCVTIWLIKMNRCSFLWLTSYLVKSLFTSSEVGKKVLFGYFLEYLLMW